MKALRAATLVALLALPGCAYFDPFERPGAWAFQGTNAANLAAMVANPMDLARGQSSASADGNAAAVAVVNYRQGQTKGLSGGGSSAPAPAAPAASAAQVSN